MASNAVSTTGLAVVARTFGRRALTWFGVTIGASLVVAAVELAISLFLQVFLRSLGILSREIELPSFLNRAVPSNATLALVLCGIAVARSAALFFVGQSPNMAMESIVARLRRLAVWEMLLRRARSPISAAQVNARVGDLAVKSAQFAYSSAQLVATTVQAFALAILMLVTAPGETLVAMVGLGAVGVMVTRLNRITRRVGANVPIELRVLTEGIERVARNTTLVRVLRTERVEHRRLTGAIDSYARHLMHGAYLGNAAGAATPFAGILLIIFIVAMSQAVFHTSPVTLLAFLYLLVRFVQLLSTAVVCFSQCNTQWPSFKDSADYVSTFTDEEIQAAMHADDVPVERPESIGGEPPEIAIESVAFSYQDGAGDVLRDVSVQVAAGSMLAIVGPSGCGKSTLLGIILGILKPMDGIVAIGGRTPNEYFADPTTRVGYVGADAFLIAGTIRENMRYGLSAPASDEDLWRALDAARMRTVVEDLPSQLEHPIAEDGSGLSAGQKQRLCLARALLNQPQLLVLDEASANLDSETEAELAETLRELRGRSTIVIVSHRPGIYRYADRVLEFASLNGATASSSAA